jgi:hypothetical protein
MRKLLFEEEQKFGSISLYLSMGLINTGTIVFFAIAFYYQFYLNQPFGDKPVSDSGLVLIAILIMLVLAISTYMLFGSVLKVSVSKNDIRFTFKPYIYKPIVYEKGDIERFEIRNYKPISEYGGWGIKQGNKKAGKAYNVKGKIGLQLYLRSDKKVLIGTQRGDALIRAIKKMMENN